MEIESSVVASQNAIVNNPTVREPQREADLRQQQEQRQETELPKNQTVVRSGDNQVFEQAEKFRQKQSSSGESFRESRDNRSQAAISAYQSLAKETKREEIRQLMGVDTYV